MRAKYTDRGALEGQYKSACAVGFLSVRIPSRGFRWLYFRLSRGELIVHERRIAATFLEKLHSARPSAFVGFCPSTLHLKRGDIAPLSAYLFPGAKTGGIDGPRFKSLSKFGGAVADPWIICADWIIIPGTLAKSGLLQAWDGKLVALQD